MKKWRPSHKAIYVIPEIKGNLHSLELILNRVLPLRQHTGQEDSLIFLGAYIDGSADSPAVLEALINIKKEYGDRVVFLRGDREELLLRALGRSEKDYDYWLRTGGAITVESYLKLAGIRDKTVPQMRLRDIIPKSHIEFLEGLPFYYETEDYFFVYGGFNPKIPLRDNSESTFAFDKSASYLYRRNYGTEEEIVVEKVVVAGYVRGAEPVIYPRYLMLGGLAPKAVICVELNSLESRRAQTGRSKIYTYPIKTYE